ncbi:MAG: protein-glutamate O-methyltransferase [Rhodocyclales bacterium]|nr:protein-glutamate O-methyltransferase [Rhodocyclales bacterium]
MGGELAISDGEFRQFRDLMRRVAGVDLADSKKHLVCGRLARRVRERGLQSFADYYRLVAGGTDGDEYHRMLDLLTTHETYFFREPKHFEYFSGPVLSELAARGCGGRPLRVWSAASSTGEEAYSLAMVLMDRLGDGMPWEILATDISREVLERARVGIYGTERIDGVPKEYQRRYFLRGIGRRSGTLRVAPELRRQVRFAEANLHGPLTALGEFDVVFLRNVLIYFDQPTKREIVARVAGRIRRGGWLFIGHSESLNGISAALRQERPTIYRRD